MRRLLASIAIAAGLVGAGCGSTSRTAHTARRPPVPRNVSAALNGRRVLLSPRHVKGGQIDLTLTNFSAQTRSVTVRRGAHGAVVAATRPVTPQGTAAVSFDVEPGRYVLSAGAHVRSAVLRVSGHRRSSENVLLLP